MSLVGQGKTHSKTERHGSCCQLPPDRLFLSTDCARLSDYAQDAGKR